MRNWYLINWHGSSCHDNFLAKRRGDHETLATDCEIPGRPFNPTFAQLAIKSIEVPGAWEHWKGLYSELQLAPCSSIRGPFPPEPPEPMGLRSKETQWGYCVQEFGCGAQANVFPFSKSTGANFRSWWNGMGFTWIYGRSQTFDSRNAKVKSWPAWAKCLGSQHSVVFSIL